MNKTSLLDPAELKKLTSTISVTDFEKLPMEQQADIVVMTNLFAKKFDQFLRERRKALEKVLPDEGMEYDRFTIKWQKGRGTWLVDEEKLMKNNPKKVIKIIDPIFRDDYLARVKKQSSENPNYSLPEEVSYVEPNSRTMVIRERKAK